MAGKLKGCWWGTDDMAILERLWPERSASEIGAVLKMTRNSIIGKARRMKLPAKAVGVHSGSKRAKSSRGSTESRRAHMHSEARLPRHGVKVATVTLELAGVAPGPREAIPSEGLHIIDLERHHCRYIVGQCGDGSARYCGQQKTAWRHPRSRVVLPVSYCAQHAALCYSQ